MLLHRWIPARTPEITSTQPKVPEAAEPKAPEPKAAVAKSVPKVQVNRPKTKPKGRTAQPVAVSVPAAWVVNAVARTTDVLPVRRVDAVTVIMRPDSALGSVATLVHCQIGFIVVGQIVRNAHVVVVVFK